MTVPAQDSAEPRRRYDGVYMGRLRWSPTEQAAQSPAAAQLLHQVHRVDAELGQQAGVAIGVHLGGQFLICLLGLGVVALRTQQLEDLVLVDVHVGLPTPDAATDALVHLGTQRRPGSQPAFAAGCDAAGGDAPTLTPGEDFSVSVTVTVRIPLLPEFVDSNTATGQFVVERDRYVDGWHDSTAPVTAP